MDRRGELIIAIDGPSGTGKSTVAILLSERLGYRYLDTGAMYRAVAYKIDGEGIDVRAEGSLSRSLEDVKI